MDQAKKIISIKKELHEGQFLYLGRWVDKDSFRAFVYDKDGQQKLANDYHQYESMISSGLWFSSKPTVSKDRKQKYVTHSDSQ